MPAGRPKTFANPRALTVSVEREWYRQLAGGMLSQYRQSHPEASMSDLVRHLIDKGIREYQHTAPERERAEKERRQRLRKLAVACVSAPDDKLESQARRLAALVEE